MGNKGGKAKKGADGESKATNDKITKTLIQQKEIDQEVIKLLLLGAGESGKSTLFRQMVQIYGVGFAEKELALHLPMVHNNTISSMKELCVQSKALNQKVECHDALEAMNKVDGEDKLTPEIAKVIKQLWADAGIKATYSQKSKFHLIDSAAYFFEHLDRTSRADYLPTAEDLIHLRVRTTGIVENRFTIEGNHFLMVDVGGQRNERKKWIHCFEGVTAVIFVCAISEYDQTLYEDGKTNRMDEAVTLFNEICHLKWFQQTSFILFLNKKDLFTEKIAKVPFTVWKGAETMTGSPHSFDDAVGFVRRLFESKYPSTSNKKLYVHVTCATQSDNVAEVFGAVKDIIIQAHLTDSGLI